MGWEYSGVVGFHLGPLLQGQMRTAKLKSAYNSLVIGSTGLQCKSTYRKSCAANLLMWTDLTLDPSFKVKRRQPNLKVLITCFLLVLEDWDSKPIYRKTWAWNLLEWSYLTLGPSFKVNEDSQR